MLPPFKVQVHMNGNGYITYQPFPQHIALIMDGNGRWARIRGLSRTLGHRAGTENMVDIIYECLMLGVRYLTIYVFSTENWKRPPHEVDGMLHLVSEFIDRELWTIHEWGIRLHHLGRMEQLEETLASRVRYALDLTQHNRQMVLGVALNYGSRDDILEAVRAIMSRGGPPHEINEQTIAAYLSTAEMPEADLIIRTSGEQRLSNFLLWEGAHSIFWSTPVFWPDFRPWHLYQALNVYQKQRSMMMGEEQEKTCKLPLLERATCSG